MKIRLLLLSLALLHCRAFAQTSVVGNGLTYSNGNVSISNTLSAGEYGWAARTDQNFVFDGDSITAGNALPDSQTWSFYAMSLPWFVGRGTRYNVAHNGYTVADIAQSDHWDALVVPHAPTGSIKQAYYFLEIGHNDCKSVSAASTFSGISARWAAAKTLGFKVVAFTIKPSGNAANSSGGDWESCRQTVNASIRASAGWDFLIDFDQLWTNYADTTYISDGTHFTALGAQKTGAYVNQVMATGGGIVKFGAPLTIPQTHISNATNGEAYTEMRWDGQTGLGIRALQNFADYQHFQEADLMFWGDHTYLQAKQTGGLTDPRIYIKVFGTGSINLVTANSTRLSIAADGTVTVAALAGTGTRPVCATATGALSPCP